MKANVKVEENTVFIIDGITTAIILSILGKGKKIKNCIIEEKDGNFFEKNIVNINNRLMLDMIVSEIEIENLYTVKVPNITLLDIRNINGWTDLLLAKRKVKEFLSNIHEESLETSTYYGAPTSTIMNLLPFKGAAIRHIDHGVECLFRNQQRQSKSKLKAAAKEMVRKWLNIYNYPMNNNTGFGYTLANCVDDTYQHIDYNDFENKYIEKLLEELIEYSHKSSKKLVLFLPETQFEYDRYLRVRKIKQYDLPYGEIYSNIAKNINGNDEVVVFKFHPIFYLQSEDRIQEEISVIKSIFTSHSIKSHHIDELVKIPLIKNVPAELLLKYGGFDTLISMGSTSALNVANASSNIKCISYTEDLLAYDEYMNEYKRRNNYIEHR